MTDLNQQRIEVTRPDTKDHEKNASFMAKALALAGRSFDSQEVPVGAIVVVDGKIVGRGFKDRKSVV